MFKSLNPILHSELRLGIMSLLISIQEADFVYIMEQTKSTGGNLGAQIVKLQKAGYLEVKKSFKANRPCTTCKITPKGIAAFDEYLEALKTYIQK